MTDWLIVILAIALFLLLAYDIIKSRGKSLPVESCFQDSDKRLNYKSMHNFNLGLCYVLPDKVVITNVPSIAHSTNLQKFPAVVIFVACFSYLIYYCISLDAYILASIIGFTIALVSFKIYY